jgi:flagellar motor switch protein FliN
MSEEPNNTVDGESREMGRDSSAAPSGPPAESPATKEPSAAVAPSSESPESPESPESLAAAEPSAVPEPRSTAEPAIAPGGDERPADQRGYPNNIRRILDMHLPVTVSFGSTNRSLHDVLKLSPGSLIELDKSADDPVVLKINDKPFAWGRVVDVDGYYGVEITEILAPADRIASLGGE